VILRLRQKWGAAPPFQPATALRWINPSYAGIG
jgi:hypothetical protein